MKDFITKNTTTVTTTREYSDGSVVTVTVSTVDYNKTYNDYKIGKARKSQDSFYADRYSVSANMSSILDAYNEWKENM